MMMGKVDLLTQGVPGFKTFSTGPATETPSFQNIFQQWIKAASHAEQEAQSLAHQFAVGAQDVSIHQVVISAQKSLITLKAGTEVTKSCLNAYQEIWNMPI